MTMNEEFNSLIKDIDHNVKFNKLKEQNHHGITRYEHSMRVARWTYKMCKLFKMKSLEETTRAALLHDFYVDTDLEGSSAKRLGLHSTAALENSLKYFELSKVQKDIIKTHMFPCNLNIPKYKESWLVTGVDKAVSTFEMIKYKGPLYAGIYAVFLFNLIRIPR